MTLKTYQHNIVDIFLSIQHLSNFFTVQNIFATSLEYLTEDGILNTPKSNIFLSELFFKFLDIKTIK